MIRLRCSGDIADAAAALGARNPRFAEIWIATGPWPDRLRPPGFFTLVQTIAGQQVSTASARAIVARLEAAGLTGARAVRAASPEELRACGLSRPKARSIAALAAAEIDFAALEQAPLDTVIDTLTALPGIGRWTAEIYALSALGHPDVLPAGDLALQEGARLAFGLPARPSEAGLRGIAGDWAPWRAVAARGLWAYYARVRGREGAA